MNNVFSVDSHLKNVIYFFNDLLLFSVLCGLHIVHLEETLKI